MFGAADDSCTSFHCAWSPTLTLQVYLILDEFILGGEFEETSKKASNIMIGATSSCVHAAVTAQHRPSAHSCVFGRFC